MLNDERISNMVSKFTSNYIDLHFRPKTVENWLNRVFYQFSSFLAKRGKIFSDLNFEARFGILSSFSNLEDPICYYFHILNF